MMLWTLGAIAPVLCLVAAWPGIAVAYLLSYPLVYAGPVVGIAVIAGGAVGRRRIRRELAGGVGLEAAAAGGPGGRGGRGAFGAALAGTAGDRAPAPGASEPGDAALVAPDRGDAALVAREASGFRLVRQSSLLVAYSAVGVVGIVTVGSAMLGESTLAWFSLSSFAFLGILIACVAPGWAFGRGVVVGEEHALLTRTGSWRLILALRILALVVGGVATLLSLYAAVSLPLGGWGAVLVF